MEDERHHEDLRGGRERASTNQNGGGDAGVVAQVVDEESGEIKDQRQRQRHQHGQIRRRNEIAWHDHERDERLRQHDGRHQPLPLPVACGHLIHAIIDQL